MRSATRAARLKVVIFIIAFGKEDPGLVHPFGITYNFNSRIDHFAQVELFDILKQVIDFCVDHAPVIADHAETDL
jgi:hypothetical protein